MDDAGQPENTDDFKELMARTLFGLGKYEDSERCSTNCSTTTPSRSAIGMPSLRYSS